MARTFFIMAMLLMASAIGVIGYQFFFYLIKETWPVVTAAQVWAPMFGPLPETQFLSLGHVWTWLGAWPMAALAFAASYVAFLASDTLRR